MLELITNPAMAPFVASLALVGAVGLIELCAVLAFGPIFTSLHVHVDLDGSPFDGALSWLHVGKVPLMALIVLFLAGFGLAGAGIQLALQGLGHGFADALGVSIPAVGVGLGAVRRIGGVLAKMFGEDSSAVSADSFVGETARIVIGTARAGLPAEARLTDKHGRKHYVMVTPSASEESFTEGTEVILERRGASGFEASRKTKVIN